MSETNERYKLLIFPKNQVQNKIIVDLGSPAASGWLTTYREVLDNNPTVALIPRPAFSHLSPAYLEVPTGATFLYYVRVVGILNCGNAERLETRSYMLGYTINGVRTILEIDEDDAISLKTYAEDEEI